ncbi:MAG: proline--tRNA ligase [Candidatus Kapabacteria bacterium]|nr:proline--tRNA ligase [Candidatus Kapabacteria bacterium]
MKQSKYFIPTLKEAPSDALIPSHILMLRAGLVRQLASGIFSFLPLGYKIKKKVIEILRREMDAIGGQEFLLPALNPIDIWEQTGRVEAMGDVMFHIKNREGLVLAPTHEEIITYHARQHVKSYRDMPQIWYQIQNKFRNEPRPKSGVLRGRQFTMKDSYSLDATFEGLNESYEFHRTAYQKIFDSIGLKYFIVSASSGAMGGRQSEEFMVESDSGEDTCAVCDDCGYAANFEIATSDVEPVGRIQSDDHYEEFATPNAKTINELIVQFNLTEDQCAKSVVYIVDSAPVLIFMRGNDEMNETKLQSIFKTNQVRPAEADELVKYFGASTGSLGPINIPTKIKVIADLRLKDANGLVSGANKDGYHFKNIDFIRDCNINEYHDLRTVSAGEKCSKCGSALRVVKAIELGHIFKLGTKYSEALGAHFLDAAGAEHPIIMGSYGIGVERIIACYIEQNYDDHGIIWKKALTPFQVHLIGLNFTKSPETAEVSERIYKRLTDAGWEVLFDDRTDSPGIKFNDADLIGIPVQIICGPKNISQGKVEVKIRHNNERSTVDEAEIELILSEFYK